MGKKKREFPPKLATWLLHRLCREEYLDEVHGDLLEVFEWRVATEGRLKAKTKYFIDVISAARFYKNNQVKILSKFPKVMLFNIIKNSIRNFRGHLSYTLLNIFGLAVGMMAALFILEFVSDELSYDRFSQSSDMYRVSQDFVSNGELLYQTAVTAAPLAEAMQSNLPKVEKVGRLFDYTRTWAGKNIFTLPEDPAKTFEEPSAYFSDPAIVDLFDFKLTHGVSKLNEPNTVLLSVEMAEKYFGGSQEAIGKLIKFISAKKSPELIVTGVFEYPEFNLQVKPSALISYATLKNEDHQGIYGMWGVNSNLTYVKLKDGTDPNEFREDLEDLLLKYNPLETEEDRNGMRIGSLHVAPITSIHLNSSYQDEVGAVGNKTTIYLLIVVSIFIVVMAWINYINLSTANSMNRSKEVGVRKVMGARRNELVILFFAEAFLINVFAVFLALTLVSLGQPFFDQFVERPLSLANIDFTRFGISMITVFALGTFLSGIYPAAALSSFGVIMALKGKNRGNSSSGLRRGLVVFQLLFSSLIIMGTLATYMQLNFMNQANLGLDMQNVLVLEGPTIKDSDNTVKTNKVDLLKNELKSLSSVINVGVSNSIPGNSIIQSQSISRVNTNDSERNQFEVVSGSEYLNILGMKLVAGEMFDLAANSGDDQQVILNYSAARQLGFSNPSEAVGQSIYAWFNGGRSQLRVIKGVIGDYHHESLNRSIDPMIFYPGDSRDYYYLLKLEEGSSQNLYGQIEDLYSEIFPGNPANYYFLDTVFVRQYIQEKVNSRVFVGFALVAIIVACLGLYGLSSFTALQRTKEIGVRKVLGAKVQSVFFLLSKELLLLTGIGFLLAVPIGFILIKRWLESFAYHISLTPILFIIPLLLVLVVALAATSRQVLKAAIRNPVRSLRQE